MGKRIWMLVALVVVVGVGVCLVSRGSAAVALTPAEDDVAVVQQVGEAPVLGMTEGAWLRLYTPQLEINQSDYITVTVRVQDVSQLYGVDFHLQFDPALLRVVDANAAIDGVQIAPGDMLSPLLIPRNEVSNATGDVNYAASLYFPSEPVSGSGAIAHILFEAISIGTTQITMERALLAGMSGLPLEFNLGQPLQITVNPGFKVYTPLLLKNRLAP